VTSGISPPAGRVSSGPVVPRLRGVSFRSGLTAIVVLALAVRIVVVLATPAYVPQTDASDYDRIAVVLADTGSLPGSVIAPGGGPSALRGPAFPLTLAAVYKIVGTGSADARWEAGRIYEAVLGAITVALIGLIALRLFGPATGLLSAAIGAVYPPLVLVGTSLMTEPLFIALLLGAVLAALEHRASRRRWRWVVASGLLAGLAALSRGNGIAIVIPLCFLVWTGRPRCSRRAVSAPLALLAAAAAILAPWTVRNYLQFHTFVPITTQSGFALAGTYNSYSAHRADYPAMWIPPVLDTVRELAEHPGIDEAHLSTRLDGDAINYIEAHPAYPLKVAYWSARRLLDLAGTGFERWEAIYEAYPPELAVISMYAFWALGLIAIAGACTRAARRAPWALWCCPLVLLLSTVFVIGATRYRVPADPFLVILAALALLRITASAGSRQGPRPA
jgi:4-amino-4-deoxy-L-arabinose transferase-like glycosyltransferase